MKNLFKLLAIALLLISCSTSQEDLLNKPHQNNPKATQLAVGCGDIYSVQTLFTSGSPSVFIGVRYDLVLDVPQGGFTKGYFIMNDALNNATTNQYYTNNQPTFVCRNDLTLYP